MNNAELRAAVEALDQAHRELTTASKTLPDPYDSTHPLVAIRQRLAGLTSDLETYMHGNQQ